MKPELFIVNALNPALNMLPAKMDTPEARAMLLAIAMQESGLIHRVQLGGPAHGYWQFERGGGCAGVLTHPASSPLAITACGRLDYQPTPNEVYDAIVNNDILACIFARLLLWTSPHPLPKQDQPELGWSEYLAAWRPGAPHHPQWGDNFRFGWHWATTVL